MSFYLKESLRLQEMAEEDNRIKLAEKCLDWAFKEHDKDVAYRTSGSVVFHMQGLLQRGPNQLRTKAKAERVLKFLHEHGLARKLTTTVIGGVERKEAWEVRRYEIEQKVA